VTAARAAPSVRETLQEYGRGLAGGLIFSLPLLYTMEVWWSGFIASPHRLLIYLICTFALLLGYNNFAGIRHDASWTEVFIDSVEELGLGVLTAAAALFLLGQIGRHSTFAEALGKVVVEAGIVAIGFSIGTAQLGAGGQEDTGKGSDDKRPSFWSQLVIALCGAVLFAANIAPTEEVVMIAIETPMPRLLALAVLSMTLGALVLYFSDFTRAGKFVHVVKRHEPLLGSVITYAVAVTASAAILWFFGRFDGCALDVCVRQTVVLALPATIGASAGRLLLQS
jgi:putative integral membrane protein (TIGR02587 family)